MGVEKKNKMCKWTNSGKERRWVEKDLLDGEERWVTDVFSKNEECASGYWEELLLIQAMKDTYLLKLNEILHKVVTKIHKPLEAKDLQFEKLKAFGTMLECFIAILKVSKSNVQPTLKDRLGTYEKQIITILSSNKRQQPDPSMQQRPALPQPHTFQLQHITLIQQMNLHQELIIQQNQLHSSHQSVIAHDRLVEDMEGKLVKWMDKLGRSR